MKPSEPIFDTPGVEMRGSIRPLKRHCVRIKLPNLFPWKHAFLAFCVGICLPVGVFAQCANNLAAKTYDTLVTGPGYGTYHLSFPKWNTDSGLLVSVKINAMVNVQYSYTLKNVDTLAGAYSIWVGREDFFSSPAMSGAYDNTYEQKIGTYPLNPGESAASAPFPFLSNYANVDSITGNTAPFLGAGTVSFTYSPITYTNIRISNNASYNYHATAPDQTHFSVTYLYCKGDGVLARGLTAFTALALTPAMVQLDWSATEEAPGRVYEVQRSEDGESFSTIGSRVAMGQGKYAFVDQPPASSTYYYRLRIVDPGGISYSPIRSVTLSANAVGRLTIYPNPAVDHINLVMPGDAASPGDWRVDLRAADGRLIQCANFFHSKAIPLFFHQKLSPGVYFVRVSDLQGYYSQVASFRVDRR